jgi:hypothetical protein
MGALRIFAVLLLAGPVGAQVPASSPVDAAKSEVAQLSAGQDVFFAFNGYTFTSLLRLRTDGTFAGYSREHMFVGISDEGRWRQLVDGTLLLCSHYRFEPIKAGALSVWVREPDIQELPALVSAIQKRLDALPSKRSLTAKDLRPLIFRSWLSEKSLDAKVPAGSIAPPIEGDDKAASRSDLLALTEAIRRRLANRDGTLTSKRVMRLGPVTWLAEPGRDVEKELLEEYRRHKDGPFLPGAASVAVDERTFHDLLGTRQSFLYYTEMNQVIARDAPLEDLRRERIKIPECGVHEELARPLPTTAASDGPKKY